MASWLFGSGSAASPPTYFEIRLEHSTLRLPGADENTSYGHLNGTVVLCVDKPLYTKDIKLYLRGTHCANWKNTSTQPGRTWREVTFYSQTWNFLQASNRNIILQPDNYEFPFSISLRNTMPESVDGLDDCYIRYELTATIDAPRGAMQTSKMMKVSRTPDFLSFLEPEGIERSWPDKIVYELRIPGRAYVLGDPIQLDFQYIALRKGVYPTSIQLRLVERHTLKSTGGLGHSQHTQTRTHTRSRIRGEDTSSYEESSGTSVISEDMEEWRVSSPVLPSSQTKSCVPSCQTSIIDVEHSLDVTIMLHNPDGHFSMITATLPISMCLRPGWKPPGLSLNSDSTHVTQPPPSYNHYLRDQPFHMVDICKSSEETGDTMDYPRIDSGDLSSYPDDFIEPPDYDIARCSAIPNTSTSPCYWGTISA